MKKKVSYLIFKKKKRWKRKKKLVGKNGLWINDVEIVKRIKERLWFGLIKIEEEWLDKKSRMKWKDTSVIKKD